MCTSPFTVRPLREDDGAAVDAVFAGLSPFGRSMRLGTAPALPDEQRRRLLNGDGRTRLALVAEVPEGGLVRPVGIAELIRTAPGRAELAIEVAGSWTRRGVGTRLLRELARTAAGLGYTELDAEVLMVNRPVIALLRRVFPATTTTRFGPELVITIPLTEGPAEGRAKGAAA
jgi:RimJ/RimL family protein N-acetyltransferase